MATNFELSTGKKIELFDLTMPQREECEDATTKIVLPGGGIEIKGTARSRNMWCRYGMQVDSDALMEYTSAELDEIMLEVGRRAKVYVDPTTREG